MTCACLCVEEDEGRPREEVHGGRDRSRGGGRDPARDSRRDGPAGLGRSGSRVVHCRLRTRTHKLPVDRRRRRWRRLRRGHVFHVTPAVLEVVLLNGGCRAACAKRCRDGCPPILFLAGLQGERSKTGLLRRRPPQAAAERRPALSRGRAHRDSRRGDLRRRLRGALLSGRFRGAFLCWRSRCPRGRPPGRLRRWRHGGRAQSPQNISRGKEGVNIW